jgi:hypothetical protein
MLSIIERTLIKGAYAFNCGEKARFSSDNWSAYLLFKKELE